MDKFNLDDPAIQELLSDPRVIKLQQEYHDFINEEYVAFDTIDFVGESCGGLVKAHYCYGKKGFHKVEVQDSLYLDKNLTCDYLPAAINDALLKYNAGLKQSEVRVLTKESELYTELTNIALEKSKKPPIATPNKKTYLN
jgi:DNA-binding protein YbaB